MRTDRTVERLVLATGALYFALTLAASAWLAYGGRDSMLHRVAGSTVCSVRARTGIPCPLCFGTTTYVLTWRGRWREAARLNPFAFGLFGVSAAFVVLAPMQIVSRRPLRDRLRRVSARGWFVVSVMAVGLLFLNWLYLIVRSEFTL